MKKDQYSVALVPCEGMRILSDNPVSVDPGQSACFAIEIQDNYISDDRSGLRYESGVLFADNITVSQSIYYTPRRACAVRVDDLYTDNIELPVSAGFYAGDRVEFRLTPPEHYADSRILVNGEVVDEVVSGDTHSFSIYNDSVISLKLIGEALDFSVKADGVGAVSIANAREVYRYGDLICVNPEYDRENVRFDGWSVNGYLENGGTLLSTEQTLTLTLEADTCLYANFVDLNTYTVFIDANGGTAEHTIMLEKCSANHERFLPCDDGTLRREGYTLIGYNTRPDGSGTHYAPASPVMVTRGDCTLYAEWLADTPSWLLTYQTVQGTVKITGRNGDIGDTLCIPREIEGLPVRSVANQAFAGDETLKTVVLPIGVREVGEGAFSNCPNLSTVYLPDTLRFMGENAFAAPNFRHMRVLASTDTQVYERTYEAGLADRYMRLTSTTGKRLILLAGSSGSFGLRSDLLAEHFPGYTVINFSGSYSFGIQTMLSYVQNHVHEGDLVIVAPEYYGAMYASKSANGIANWQYLESNYNMLDDLDIQSVWNEVFSSYIEYLSEKRDILPGKQSVRGIFARSKFNVYGDIVEPRTHKTKVKQYIPDAAIISEDGMKVLSAAFQKMKNKGALCLFSFPPVSVGKEKNEALTVAYEEFTGLVTKALVGSDCTVISNAADYLFPADAFYDNRYHMTNDGAVMRTQQLIADLDNCGLIDEAGGGWR